MSHYYYKIGKSNVSSVNIKHIGITMDNKLTLDI